MIREVVLRKRSYPGVWNVRLACGHTIKVKSIKRPRIKTAECPDCTKGYADARKAIAELLK